MEGKVLSEKEICSLSRFEEKQSVYEAAFLVGYPEDYCWISMMEMEFWEIAYKQADCGKSTKSNVFFLLQAVDK